LTITTGPGVLGLDEGFLGELGLGAEGSFTSGEPGRLFFPGSGAGGLFTLILFKASKEFYIDDRNYLNL
jgi:hypothetical protein